MEKAVPCFESVVHDFALYDGDSRKVVPLFPRKTFNMVFADPPYFLSNGGFTVQDGKKVCVNKGKWDKSPGNQKIRAFNHAWIGACREVMTDDATIWICGTFHNIFSVASVLSELDFKILNAITWQKTNPPPNLSCRFFTHSTELIVWARKSERVPHYYNYELMHRIAGGHQMTDVWKMPAIAPWEKTCGKHPTQKPLALAVRAILACTCANECVLDPFAGSSTTGIAANLLGRRFVGVEQDKRFLEMSIKRRNAYDEQKEIWKQKIPDLKMIRGV